MVIKRVLLDEKPAKTGVLLHSSNGRKMGKVVKRGGFGSGNTAFEVVDPETIPRKSSVALGRVMMVLKNLVRLEKRFNHRRPRNFWTYNIHKKPGTTNYELMRQIVDYLEELRGPATNPIESLVYDYLVAIYEYYQRFRRVPNINQFRPYGSNQLNFDEWVMEWERVRNENYWIMEEQPKPVIRKHSIDKVAIKIGRVRL